MKGGHFIHMENISSNVMDKVLSLTKEYNCSEYSKSDVSRALNADKSSVDDLSALLSPAADDLLEEIAKRSKEETMKRFGNSVSIFTPLYISNHCSNSCTYCGFNRDNDIVRGKLSFEEMEREMKAISETGLEEILILTGESRKESGPEYIGEAVKIAKRYFSTIGIEVYPLNTDEYSYIHECGADFVSVYQETYDREIYKEHHLGGPKSVFSYRFNAQERALMGGMDGVGFGSLLGLGDFRKDAFSTAVHAYLIQQKYPHAEISFSVPRIRSYIKDNGSNVSHTVREKQLLQVLLAYRIFMPSSSITISTREREGFRDNVIGLAANRISAGVNVGIGGHDVEKKGDEQFEISDLRDVSQVHAMIIKKGLQPVYTDHIRM